ncbi:MAG: vitamin B12-dependent ribonucleotide reductase [Bacillota bacterium]
MKITENARKILEKRYLKKKDGIPIETPEDMFKRVASFVAGAELSFNPKISKKDLKAIEDKFYHLMANMDFQPNSPTLMNAGRDLGQLSACFVLPIDDSMEGIFTAVKDAALIHKSGGGTGFSFSRIRPKNSPVQTTGGVASGPVSFMKVFNAATEAIKQGGTRRGANMGILRVDHPDILEFITCKQDNNDLTNFNISVGITDSFMKALEYDDYYELCFNNQIYDRYKAREIFELIVERAWANGEPGIVFLDKLNQGNPTPLLGEIEATNPCGEQPLLGYEACNLGSINVENTFENGSINWDKLEDIISWSMRFLDNVIEVNKFPLEKIQTIVEGNRKVGLGIMGWANLLYRLRIPYNSEEAIVLAEKLMSFIQNKAHEASVKLALERGNFPNIDKSIYAGQKMRNATCTTIAPTGTISMIAGTSSGIEPAFSIAYTKNVLDGAKLMEVNPIFEEYVNNNYAKEKAKKIIETVASVGSVSEVAELPENIRKVFITALEIEPDWHIKMQAAFQRYCDNAVSKTVNFPYEATKSDVFKAYMLAYQLGCKGVTVYRTGSREEEVLTKGSGKKVDSPVRIEKLYPRPRPKRTIGVTEQVNTGCGRMYITVNYDQEGLIETFITTGSSGGCSGFTEGVSRLISLALRANIAPDAIIDQLTSVSCPTFLKRKASNNSLVGKSCPDIIGKILTQELQFVNDNKDIKGVIKDAISELSASCEAHISKFDELSEAQLISLGICPDCKEKLRFAEGCLKCECGFSKCG